MNMKTYNARHVFLETRYGEAAGFPPGRQENHYEYHTVRFPNYP